MSRIIGTSVDLPIVKFQNKEIIEKIQSGKMYLKNLEWFREKERQTGDMTIGDLLEGMLHISEGYMQIYDSDGKVIECVPLTDSAITTSFSNAFVFCATNIFPDESGHVFADNQKPVFKEFGDTALVIENKGEFIKRIYKAAKELGYEVFYGVVNYYNKDEDNANMHISLLHGMHNIAFWKRDTYKVQQEFRIVLWKKDANKDYIEFDIGDISDISKVISIEEALRIQIKKQA